MQFDVKATLKFLGNFVILIWFDYHLSDFENQFYRNLKLNWNETENVFFPINLQLVWDFYKIFLIFFPLLDFYNEAGWSLWNVRLKRWWPELMESICGWVGTVENLQLILWPTIRAVIVALNIFRRFF